VSALTSLLAADTTRIATPQVSWRALLPIVILLVGGILLLTIASLTRKRPTTSWYAPYTVAVAAAAAVSVLPLWARVQRWDRLLWIDMPRSPRGPFSTVAGMVGIDGFGLFVIVVVCAAVALGALLAGSYLRREEINGPEFFALLLLAGAGGAIMATADDFIVMFLGLETLSLAAYILTAIHLRRAQSQESGIKYFVLGAFSSAFLLYGIAMIYGGTGTTNFIKIANYFGVAVTGSGVTAGNVPIHNGLLLVGLALVLVGLGFKVAAVPFHTWSPDVYDGAPTPSVAFMAGAVKAGAFAGLIRVFVLTFPNFVTDWRPIVWGLAILSMLLGSIVATVQNNVKRTLAYSSINHAGFILLAVGAASAAGNSAVLFYLAAYTFMVAGAFAVVGVVARKGDGHTSLSDFRGLSRSNPLLAGAMTVFLLAQAGIPFTSGFFAKFYALDSVIEHNNDWLALVAMLSGAIAAFLYLRIVVMMYLTDGDAEGQTVPRLRVPAGTKVALGLCLIVTLGAGIAPQLIVGPATHGTPYLVEPPAPTPPPRGSGSGSSGGTTPSSTTIPGLGTGSPTAPGAAPATGN
jgi:NADH-quinone oxidoreductase subunit N